MAGADLLPVAAPMGPADGSGEGSDRKLAAQALQDGRPQGVTIEPVYIKFNYSAWVLFFELQILKASFIFL